MVTAVGQPFERAFCSITGATEGVSSGDLSPEIPSTVEGKQSGNGPQIENKINRGIAGRTCKMSVRTASNNWVSKRLTRYS